MFQKGAKVLCGGVVHICNVYCNGYDFYVDLGGERKLWVRLVLGKSHDFECKE